MEENNDDKFMPPPIMGPIEPIETIGRAVEIIMILFASNEFLLILLILLLLLLLYLNSYYISD